MICPKCQSPASYTAGPRLWIGEETDAELGDYDQLEDVELWVCVKSHPFYLPKA